MKPIKVVVHGALGRMGKEVINALCHDPEFQIVGAVEKAVVQTSLALPDGKGQVPFSADLVAILTECQPQVVVDFSVAESTKAAFPVILGRGVNMVTGTTGLSQDDLAEINHMAEAHKVGVIAAPNFSLGAVVLTCLARLAAKHFDYAEVIEMHHERKVDAPSGTALAAVRSMVQARGKPFIYPPTTKESLSGCRGGQLDGVAIHSVRSPGYMAHLEVILGIAGQTLTLRHDQISREAFMPGVKLAVKEVVKRKGLVYGLDALFVL